LSALRSLLVFGIVFTVTAFGSEALSEIAGPLEYKGYIVFAYTEGENPINHIAFTVDMTIAPDLMILDVPAGWGHIYIGRVLTLSGGSLSPGGMVQVQVSLNGHHPSGNYPIDSSGTTTAGELVLSSGVLMVGDLHILNFLTILNSLRYPIFASTFGLGFLEMFKRLKREDKELLDSGFISDDRLELVTEPTILPDDGGEVIPFEPEPDFEVTPGPESFKIDTGEPTPFDLEDIGPQGELELDLEPENEPELPVHDGTSYEDLFEQAVRRVHDHNPGWADHGVHDPGITIMELLNSITQDLGYRVYYSAEDFSFLNSHELTGGQVRELVIDTVSSATEKGERVNTEHVKAALERLKKN
jgi:hypothetical protein